MWTWSRGAAGGAVPWKGVPGAPEPQPGVGLGGNKAHMCPCEQHTARGRLRAPCCVSQRYLDGELAMWRANFVSRTTITISAFAGEYDICPRDGPAAFLTFQLSDCILQISKMNITRLVCIFQPPSQQVSCSSRYPEP